MNMNMKDLESRLERALLKHAVEEIDISVAFENEDVAEVLCELLATVVERMQEKCEL